jgi:hypothetical protein
VAVFTRRGAERKRRGTRPRRGSYAGIRTQHARGADVAGGRPRRREVAGGDQATAALPRAHGRVLAGIAWAAGKRALPLF